MTSLKTKLIISYLVLGVISIVLHIGVGLTFVPILIILFFLSLITGYIFSNKITESIDRFQKLINNVSSGHLKIDFNEQSADVIDDVSESINRMISGFSALLEISRLLTKETSLNKLLNLIIDQTTKLMDAERTTLFLYDSDTNELWSYIAQDLEIKEIRLPLGRGIAGNVAKTGKMINIRDAYADPRFDDNLDKNTGFKTRSVLCVPLFDHRKSMLGVLQVLNKKSGYFREHDESLLNALASNAGVAIENARLYEAQENLFKGFIKTIAAVIDARDPVTRGHSQRVSRYAVALGKELGFSENQLKLLECAAILHDVGKISIPDAVLQKPGEFTKEEYEIVKKHTLYTKEILLNIYSSSDFSEIPAMASSHHEKLDGSGYPLGLKSEAIPLESKILAVVDVFDALVSYDRPYKPAMPPEKAIEILKSDTLKGKFDKKIVDIFIDKKLYQIERREYVRISAELSIEYKVLSSDEKRQVDLFKTTTKNISAIGLQFETKDTISEGDSLEIRLFFHQHTFDLIGRVVWEEKIGDKKSLGVSFENIDAHLKNQISGYLTDFNKKKVYI
ncbi:MAG: hypothetical protein A2252_07775 [Elusimicrobia bacterium RIFOXYA2_FULL_39_19]|nr:MAG: hypothetical protein A2252_07775 [Elusimicrobia bacterium RIFOXYA2_FULL_39_19]